MMKVEMDLMQQMLVLSLQLTDLVMIIGLMHLMVMMGQKGTSILILEHIKQLPFVHGLNPLTLLLIIRLSYFLEQQSPSISKY